MYGEGQVVSIGGGLHASFGSLLKRSTNLQQSLARLVIVLVIGHSVCLPMQGNHKDEGVCCLQQKKSGQALMT